MKTLSEDRRALHRIPETGCRLPETAAYLRGALAEMPCTLLAPWEDAVCAYFDLGKDETVAVRSDMDALPVTERTGLPFASAHPGRMHACGHDGHMAMVLGLARRLAAGEVRPQRNVLLIFEPAEETTGGAAPICATGLLERYHVTRVFGMHLWPELPAGVIASRAGAMMSRSCELTVRPSGPLCRGLRRAGRRRPSADTAVCTGRGQALPAALRQNGKRQRPQRRERPHAS